MRTLVIGAGAVGQPYARHLAAGGADVAVLVKPEHAAEARAGFTLYPLNRSRRLRAQPERLAPHVLTDVAEVARERWDQVYVTVSSTALRAGTWFTELAAAIGDATLITLQPGLHDRAFVAARVPAARIVQGIITLVSYRAPLPGETRFAAPGVAYWLPPLAPSPMSGPRDRLDAVLAILRAGGLPARRHADVGALPSFGVALLMPIIAALERAGWSFARFRRDDHLARAAGAGREALAAVARAQGRSAPALVRLLCRPLPVRLALRFAPLLVPLDLETYLRVHFTKVGDQTRDMIGDLIALGARGGLSVDGLRALQS